MTEITAAQLEGLVDSFIDHLKSVPENSVKLFAELVKEAEAELA